MPPATEESVAFVCVQNAGRSQMAAAFAERERAARDLPGIEIVTGGTRPADRVHPDVVDAMADAGIDIADRVPRAVTAAELRSADVVVTMGCSIEAACPAGIGAETRDWDLDDPHERGEDAVAAIRDEVERRVIALFDELE